MTSRLHGLPRWSSLQGAKRRGERSGESLFKVRAVSGPIPEARNEQMTLVLYLKEFGSLIPVVPSIIALLLIHFVPGIVTWLSHHMKLWPCLAFPYRHNIRREASGSNDLRKGDATTCRTAGATATGATLGKGKFDLLFWFHQAFSPDSETCGNWPDQELAPAFCNKATMAE